MKLTNINRKLWDEYDLLFPMEKKEVCIVGNNGSGKTTMLEILKDYFIKNNENVIYLSEHRYFNHDIEESKKTIEKNTRSLKKMLGMKEEENFLIKRGIDKESLNFTNENEYITRGNLQLINFFLTCHNLEKETILIIDTPEINIHITSRRNLVKELAEFKNVKKVIVATHCPEIISFDRDACFDIEHLKKTI